MGHWTDFSPRSAQAFHPEKGPQASASPNLRSCARPSEPSTPLDARPGTTSMEPSPKRPLSLVGHIITLAPFNDFLHK